MSMKKEKKFIDYIPDATTKNAIKRTLILVSQVERDRKIRASGFLNPREQELLVEAMDRNSSVECHLYGGIENSERKIALLSFGQHMYEPWELRSFLSVIRLESSGELTHREILGALLSFGIQRRRSAIFTATAILLMSLF